MQEIDVNTVRVDSLQDLIDVVSNRYSYRYIYLNTNIQMTGGITIDPSKTELTIDGEYPAGTFHTFTDVQSDSVWDTFGIGSASSLQLELRNLTINGYNYYGVPYITEYAATQAVSVTYRNVTYRGVQMSYHPLGRVRFIDCDIRIFPQGTLEPQEVIEANQIELEGRIRISHESTNATRAVLWIRGSTTTAAVRVLPGADVEITSVNNYLLYNHEVLGLSAIPTNVTVGANARCILRMNRGISYNNQHPFNSLQVDSGAQFSYIQSAANGTNASLYLTQGLSVGQNAQFYMQAAFASAQPLIHFFSNAAQVSLSDPQSFALYNSAGPALAFDVTAALPRSFSLSAQQVNYWNPATAIGTAGTLDDWPHHRWTLGTCTLFSANGRVTTTGTVVDSSSATPAELGDEWANLQLQTARVLSVGRVCIDPDTVVDNGRPITGQTEGGAAVRVDYTIDGTAHSIPATAGEDGQFSVSTASETPPTVPIDTQLTIWANTPFLISQVSAASIFAGELLLEQVPEHVRFDLPALSLDAQVFLRRYFPQSDEEVVVLDSRVYSSAWTLSASITGDLVTDDGYSLPNALVFRIQGQPLVPLSDVPLPVYTGPSSGGVELRTTILWAQEQGILLHVTQPIRFHKEYMSRIVWTLEEVVEP